MLYRYSRSRREGGHPPPARLGDNILSLVLPAAVIAFGMALSIGVTGGFDAIVDLCRTMVGS